MTGVQGVPDALDGVDFVVGLHGVRLYGPQGVGMQQVELCQAVGGGAYQPVAETFHPVDGVVVPLETEGRDLGFGKPSARENFDSLVSDPDERHGFCLEGVLPHEVHAVIADFHLPRDGVARIEEDDFSYPFINMNINHLYLLQNIYIL